MRMLTENLPLVRTIASRVHRTLPKHVLVDDLVQAGVIGLLDALTKYDPRRRVQFQTYAKFRIRGAILDELREMDWSPRDVRRKARLLEEAHYRLQVRLARDPSESELAAEFGIKLTQLQSLKLEITRAKVEGMTMQSPRDGEEIDLCERLSGRPEETPLLLCLRSEAQGLLNTAIAELPKKQRELMMLYYRDDLTMKQVGLALGVGESRVSQLHSVAVVALRVWFTERTASSNASGPPYRAEMDGGFPNFIQRLPKRAIGL
jgi:RNA polymerase sigma factor FliA